MCIHSMPLAGPRIVLHIRFPRLFVFLYVHTYHICNAMSHITIQLVYAMQVSTFAGKFDYQDETACYSSTAAFSLAWPAAELRHDCFTCSS